MDVGTPGQSTPVRRSRRRSMTRSPSPCKTEISQLKSVNEEEESVQSTDLSSARKKRRTRSITKSPSPARTTEIKRLEVLEEELDVDAEKPLDAVTPKKQTEEDLNEETAKQSEATPVKQSVSPVVTNANNSPKQKDSPPQNKERPITEPKQASLVSPSSTSEDHTDLTKSSETENVAVVKESETKNQDVNNDEQVFCVFRFWFTVVLSIFVPLSTKKKKKNSN